MTEPRLLGIIESILFVASEAISGKDIIRVISEECPEMTAKEVRYALDRLGEKYRSESSGLFLLKIQDTYQLVSKKENNPFVEKITVKRKKKTLSQAALEVISIIAYKQPITKIEIDEIRGVKSDGIISNLTEYGLIEEKGRLDRIGRPILYGTTEMFLKEFGIDSIKNLPKIVNTENTNEGL